MTDKTGTTRSDVAQLADELIKASQASSLLTPPSSQQPFVLEAAYSVADELMRRRTAQGRTVVGRKVGLTNTSAWDALGLNAPVWGYMYADTVHYAQGGELRLPLGGMVAPKLEPEIVFRWRGAAHSETLLDNVEWLSLGYEVADCHYPDWSFKPADAVADFGLHAALVVGEPLIITQERKGELEEALKTVRVTLYKQEDRVAQGSGADVMGSPLNALEGLMKLLDARSDALQPGDVVTTGTFTPPTPVEPGERYTAIAEGMGLEPLSIVLI